MKIKIKSFDDAVQAAINAGYECDVDVGNRDYVDSILGIARTWSGWGKLVKITRVDHDDCGYFVTKADGLFVPRYCAECVIDD